MSAVLSLAHARAALFDVDGTLIDSMSVLVNGLGDAIERFAGKRPTPDEIRSLIGMPLVQQFRLYLPASTDAELETMAHYTVERYEAWKELEQPFPEALDALRACHDAGIKTALVTSKNARELELFLERFTHSQYVDAFVCASDVERPKPHPEPAFLACNLLGEQPSAAVLIGDSVFDLRCARSAGIPFIGVSYGSTPHHILAAESPELLFESPGQLSAWIDHELSTNNAKTEKRFSDPDPTASRRATG